MKFGRKVFPSAELYHIMVAILQKDTQKWQNVTFFKKNVTKTYRFT